VPPPARSNGGAPRPSFPGYPGSGAPAANGPSQPSGLQGGGPPSSGPSGGNGAALRPGTHACCGYQALYRSIPFSDYSHTQRMRSSDGRASGLLSYSSKPIHGCNSIQTSLLRRASASCIASVCIPTCLIKRDI